ncbi:complex I subunit 4 family protein [Sunxiuqinia dokdonensis]|uniref:Oxidoreductase n=1 Tax=Sunxiuqinia dokdonensis TaxID=1409788 RepID=A0A0L8V911_9BACT|nr:NADH-quinone oxidoreductase subunit M [Sunxiuqinia dokdonensis]KOH44843.1 oxidoreductase [Sunxiuqinia dokdonensis]
MQGAINFPILTLITFLPALGILIILLIPSGKDKEAIDLSKKTIKWVSLGITFIQLILAAIIYVFYNSAKTGINDINTFQFVEKVNWIHANLPLIGNIDIDYFLGIDGISVPMLLLTTIICFVAILPSFKITKAVKGYFAMYLLLDLGMVGVFCALDFFLFYVFWELMLLPMYFLIGIWGGPRKEYAAIKFFIYTLVGSVLMLLVMIGLFQSVGTFNILDMMDPANFKAGAILSGSATTLRYAAFLALFIGFAIKVPLFPFHTWLPDAHVEAPTPISVILAGVLLKMGAYGMIRIAFPIFPEAFGYFQSLIAWIGMISILYGALCALGQHRVGKRDLKKLIAYSSISHMGLVMLGLSSMRPEGMVGAIFQMFNHGTITAMLFMIVGVIYDRAHTRGLDDFGGLAKKMPVYTGIMAIAFFAAIGLPGLSGFISEVLVFLGAFKTFPVLTAVSVLSIILGAGYMLWALQKIFFGELPNKWKGPWDPTGIEYKTDDINGLELTALIPLAVIIIFLGIYPNPMIDLISGSVNHFIDLMKPFVFIGGL